MVTTEEITKIYLSKNKNISADNNYRRDLEDNVRCAMKKNANV